MTRYVILKISLCVSLMAFAVACNSHVTAKDTEGGDTGPKPATVEPDMDANNVKVDHPEQFPTATAGTYLAAPDLNATGQVNPDVSRQVPVPSLASGRVVEVDARLGDEVKKGQVLFKVRSSDISGAFSEYQKAVKNESLAKAQLDRTQLLFNNGAKSKSDLEIAQNTYDNAKVDLDAGIEHLKLLGSDPDHPSPTVDVTAPVSGVVTDQQITNSSGVQALSTPNPLTISDISHVWIVCDVYETDLPQIHVGEYADLHLTAYPDRVLKGRIGNISQILDPNLRTAKVRLEVENPGILRFGMFVTATFHGVAKEKYASVPASAILHLHDRDWVYIPASGGNFHRVEVKSGNMLPDKMQVVLSGIKPGDQVIANALVLQNTVEQ